jgi:HK97 family phage portal protein
VANILSRLFGGGEPVIDAQVEYVDESKSIVLAEPQVPVVVEKSNVDRVHASALGYGKNMTTREAFPTQKGSITPELAARIYSSSPLVNSLIRIGAGAFSQVPLKVMLSERHGVRATEKRTGYPYKLFKWVNPHMTYAGLMENLYSWQKLVGQAFWAIEENEDRYKGISEFSIYPLNPLYVKIVPDPDTGRKGYVYEVGPERLYIPDELVLHFPTFNPHDHWTGHIDLNALEYDMQIERASKKQTRNFHANAAILHGVITSPEELGDDEIRRLKAEFYQQHSGSRNAYRHLVLEKGMTYNPIKSNGSDQFLAQLLDQIGDSHAMVLGVPLALATGRSVGNKLIEVEAMMWKQNIVPFAEKVEQTITKRLCMPIQTKLPSSMRLYTSFDFSNIEALRLHELDRVRMEVARVHTGLATPNEIRATRNEEPYTGELADFGDSPMPVFTAKQSQQAQGAGTSPSLPLPGSEGGRDQSAGGEGEMLDETGTRALREETVKLISDFLKEE